MDVSRQKENKKGSYKWFSRVGQGVSMGFSGIPYGGRMSFPTLFIDVENGRFGAKKKTKRAL